MPRKLRTGGDTGVQLYKRNTSSGRYVCFNCRLCFHRPGHMSEGVKCTTCRRVMMYAGSAFRAPRRQDKKEWAKLEVLIRDGKRFHYYGAGIIPKTAKEARISRAYRKQIPILARMNSKGKRVLVKHYEYFRRRQPSAIIPITSWGQGVYEVAQ